MKKKLNLLGTVRKIHQIQNNDVDMYDLFHFTMSIKEQSSVDKCWSKLMIPNDLGQNENIDYKEQESSQPYENEGIVALKLEEVGRCQPQTLSEQVKCSTDETL